MHEKNSINFLGITIGDGYSFLNHRHIPTYYNTENYTSFNPRLCEHNVIAKDNTVY